MAAHQAKNGNGLALKVLVALVGLLTVAAAGGAKMVVGHEREIGEQRACVTALTAAFEDFRGEQRAHNAQASRMLAELLAKD